MLPMMEKYAFFSAVVDKSPILFEIEVYFLKYCTNRYLPSVISELPSRWRFENISWKLYLHIAHAIASLWMSGTSAQLRSWYSTLQHPDNNRTAINVCISSSWTFQLPLLCCMVYRFVWFLTWKIKSFENIRLKVDVFMVSFHSSGTSTNFVFFFVFTTFSLLYLLSKLDLHAELSKHLGKWCGKSSFISFEAWLSMSVSPFDFLIGGSIAKIVLIIIRGAL